MFYEFLNKQKEEKKKEAKVEAIHLIQQCL